MGRFLMLLLGLVLSVPSFAAENGVQTLSEETPTTASNTSVDPSMVPAPKGEHLSGERIRLLADFDGDGRQDLALSDDMAMGTNAGIGYTLYLADEEGMPSIRAGLFEAHYKAIAVEQSVYAVRIWTYARAGGGAGSLGYVELKDKKLGPGKYLEIYPNEGGGSNIGKALYGAALGNSDVSIRVEKSRTVDGVVHWDPINREILRIDRMDEVYRREYLNEPLVDIYGEGLAGDGAE